MIKIAINCKSAVSQGGGFRFIDSLTRIVDSSKFILVSRLSPDVDIVLLFATPFGGNATFSFFDAYAHRQRYGSKLCIRINECGKRKETKLIDWYLRLVMPLCDSVIFISGYLQNYYCNSVNCQRQKVMVIPNGVNSEVFYSKSPNSRFFKEPGKKLRLITHHWGWHRNKGLDVYNQISQLLQEDEFFKFNVEFCYVGNVPSGFLAGVSEVSAPLDGMALADKLRQADVYVTGTLHEPGGMHHLEGAACGLPVMYLNSGAVPEYQKNFGVEFEMHSLPAFVRDMYDRFDFYFDRNQKFDFYDDRMVDAYFELFSYLSDVKFQIETRWINIVLAQFICFAGSMIYRIKGKIRKISQ